MEKGDEIRNLIRRLYREATEAGVCTRFTGGESTAEEIFRLFKSPAGMEFCLERDFPSLETLRLFGPFGAERAGIYVDAGEITLYDPSCVVLAGDTRAKVYCRNVPSEGRSNHVYLLHGASADVEASGWAVAYVRGASGTRIVRGAKEYAMVL